MSELPPTAEEIRQLLPGALHRPAAEGARIVSLHWLHQLHQARLAWSLASLPGEGGLNESDPPRSPPRQAMQALHRARVSLRRLRASCKEHRDLLEGSRLGRLRAALTRLQRATNSARDADVQLDWLNAEADGLPELAREQAESLREQIAASRTKQQERVANALRRHLDSTFERACERLSLMQQTIRIGDDRAPMTFASHLASRIERSAVSLQRELDTLPTLDADTLPAALHHIRIHLKRQRALLAPHTTEHAALATWYGMATRGQDLLGAMRDAAVLAAQARYDGAEELAQVLDGVALAHEDAFRLGWSADRDAIARAQLGAAQALRSMSVAPTRDGLPMEYERKYLLRGCPPEGSAAPGTLISQGWLPGKALRERLRWSTAADGQERFTRTIKLGPSHARIEVEEDTDQALFGALWPLTASARIRKRRHVVPHGDHRWEIDVFLDRELVLAEVELSSEFEAAEIPDWLAPYVVRDVTGETQYLNAVMAQPDSSHGGSD